MRNKLLYILMVGLGIIFLSSCSISIEKRRYRPGYHVEVVKNLPTRQSKDERDEVKRIPRSSDKVVKVKSIPRTNYPTNTVELQKEKSDTLTDWKTNSIKTQTSKIPIVPLQKVKRSAKTTFPLHIFESNKVESEKNVRVIIAWVLGGIAIALTIASIILAILSWIFFAYAGIMLAIAIVLAVVALIVRFTGPKEDANTVKPLNPGFVKGIFIFSIVTLGLALGCLIVSLIIHPLAFMGWIFTFVGIVLSIISFSLGFSALDRDRSLKTKLTIIFGFIALILLAITFIIAIIV